MDEVIIYGSGNMGKGLYNLIKNHCSIVGFMDGNPALRGKTVLGVPVYHPDDIGGELKAGNQTVLIAITVCPFSEMKKMLNDYGFENVMPAGDYAAKFFSDSEMAGVWDCGGSEKVPCFSDERSCREYIAAQEWFAQRADEKNELEKDKYFPEFMRPYISQCGIMLETGSLDGGFISRFLELSAGGKVYSHMLTPASATEDELKEKFKNSDVTFFPFEASDRNCTEVCQRFGMMNPFADAEKYSVTSCRIDDTMRDIKFDFMRCYSIGKVLPILRGGEASIRKNRPVIAANISHYKVDFFEVPFYLSSVCENYEFFFRLHSYQGNDGLIYAVPKEIIK